MIAQGFADMYHTNRTLLVLTQQDLLAQQTQDAIVSASSQTANFPSQMQPFETSNMTL